MKAIILLTLFGLAKLWGNEQMCAYYTPIPSSVAVSLYDEKSAVDTNVRFTYGVTNVGDTVYATWLSNYFVVSLMPYRFDSVRLCDYDFQ